jgi:hypothetical protein
MKGARGVETVLLDRLGCQTAVLEKDSDEAELSDVAVS